MEATDRRAGSARQRDPDGHSAGAGRGRGAGRLLRPRRRAGLRDSGEFDYHLTRFCEYFVRETPDGYELGYAGTRVVDAAGADGRARADDGDAGPDAEETCPVCGTTDCERLFHVHLRAPWS